MSSKTQKWKRWILRGNNDRQLKWVGTAEVETTRAILSEAWISLALTSSLAIVRVAYKPLKTVKNFNFTVWWSRVFDCSHSSSEHLVLPLAGYQSDLRRKWKLEVNLNHLTLRFFWIQPSWSAQSKLTSCEFGCTFYTRNFLPFQTFSGEEELAVNHLLILIN